MSVLSDKSAGAFAGNNKGRLFDLLRAQGPVNPPDPDLTAWLDKALPNTASGVVTDDRWLADRLVQYGAEPRWPLPDLQERQRRSVMAGRQWANEPGAIDATLPAPGTRTPLLRALYFPGKTPRRAMVISGVHGNEQGGVEIVEQLITNMRVLPQKFSTIVVPKVFAKNYTANRRKTPDIKDPNRQMPAVGSTPGSTDSVGYRVEPENQALLELVQRFQPERLVSVHGHGPLPTVDKHNKMLTPDQVKAHIKKNGAASITVDPRPGQEADDKSLARLMAQVAKASGARIPGNLLGTPDETVIYPTDDAPHDPGVSFGTWGSHAAGSRPAICMILIETYGYPRTDQSGGFRPAERDAFVASILNVFLDPDVKPTP